MIVLVIRHDQVYRTSRAATSAAASGDPTVNAVAPGTTRFASFVSTSPGPASTNVSAPAPRSACAQES